MHHATGNAQYNLFSPHYKTPDNLFVKVPYAQYTQFVLSLQKKHYTQTSQLPTKLDISNHFFLKEEVKGTKLLISAVI